jgi:hypothetical protein
MKGTVRRPPWPAPAERTATQRQPTYDQTTPEQPPIDYLAGASNGITLAVLEEYSAAKSLGYDPLQRFGRGTPPGRRGETQAQARLTDPAAGQRSRLRPLAGRWGRIVQRGQ